MNIELRIIDKENMYDVIELGVADEQKDFVASNSFSLLQANYEDNLYPFAIYRDNELVGFVMYEFDDETDSYGMCILMVDKKFQNQGIGKATIEKLGLKKQVDLLMAK